MDQNISSIEKGQDQSPPSIGQKTPKVSLTHLSQESFQDVVQKEVVKAVQPRASQSQKVFTQQPQDNKFAVDSTESIPGHIFRYITHLYDKKNQEASGSRKSFHQIVQMSRERGKTISSLSHFQREKQQQLEEVNRQREEEEKRKQMELSKIAQEREKRREKNLRRLANQYLRWLYRTSNSQKQEEMPELKSQESEDEEVTVIENKMIPQQSIQYIVQEVTMQEVSDSEEEEEEYDPKSLISSIQSATTKIVNQIKGLQTQIKQVTQSGQILAKGSTFLQRQKAFQQMKNEKIAKQKYEKQDEETDKCSFRPKINDNPKLVNSYHSRQMTTTNSHLLKSQEKSNQTKEVSYLKKNRQKFKRNETEKYQKYLQSFQPIVEFDVGGTGVQTEWKKEINDEAKMTESQFQAYIPIQERVSYIIKSKHDKINQTLTQRQQQEEQFINSLTFRPQVLEQSISKQQQYTKRDADNFAQTQIKWKQQIEQRLLQQRMDKISKQDSI